MSKSLRHVLIDMARGRSSTEFPAGHECETLRREAQRQGALGLFGPTAPADILAALVDDAVKTTRLLDAILRIQHALTAVGIRSVALKGAALHGGAYDDITHRPMLDADLWVIDDVPRAEAVAIELGFEPIERADHAAAYREAATGAVIELHWSVTSAPGFFPVDAESVWRDRRRLATGIVAPSASDTFVLLALHSAFQHGLVLRLVQHGDFEALVRRDDVLPRQVLARAAEWRAGIALSAALQVASAVRGADPWRVWGRGGALRGLLGRLVARAHGFPEEFLEPSRPRLALVRLGVARGRRLQLIRDTLWSDVSGHGLAHAASGIVRASRLAHRHLSAKTKAAS